MEVESWSLFWSGAQGCVCGAVISYLPQQISPISASIPLCYSLGLAFGWLPGSVLAQRGWLCWMKACLLDRSWRSGCISVLFVEVVIHRGILKSPMPSRPELSHRENSSYFQTWNAVYSGLTGREKSSAIKITQILKMSFCCVLIFASHDRH